MKRSTVDKSLVSLLLSTTIVLTATAERQESDAQASVKAPQSPDSAAHRPALRLLGDFGPDWRHDWTERQLADTPTAYEVVDDDGNLVLMARSRASASGLWRMLHIHPDEYGRVSWRWKVDGTLPNDHEREKRGDDYVARIFVIFEPHFLSWRTRSICYVWASHEPIGSEYRNPYAGTVWTVVVESGDDRAGAWVAEERDIIRDYQRLFGEAPEMISGVAILVDTDNTDGEATAWFDDLVISAPYEAP